MRDRPSPSGRAERGPIIVIIIIIFINVIIVAIVTVNDCRHACAVHCARLAAFFQPAAVSLLLVYHARLPGCAFVDLAAVLLACCCRVPGQLNN